MKIDTIQEFEEILDFAFSNNFYNLEKDEQEKIKREILLARENINDIHESMKAKLLNEFRTDGYRFAGNIEKISFIYKLFPKEDKIEILSDYMNGKIEDSSRSYSSYVEIYFEVLLPMLDFLSDEEKVKVLSKTEILRLFNLMSKINIESNNYSYFSKEKKYYKKYYNICKQALERKALR